MLAQIARSAPTLRTAGVLHVKLDGLGEFSLGAAPKPPAPAHQPAPDTHQKSKRALQEDVGLDDAQAEDVLAALGRFS